MQDVQIKHIIYRTVQLNPDISKKKLSWSLSVILEQSEEVIDRCISEMMANQKDLVRCLNHFRVPESRTRKSVPVLLLRVNERNRATVEAIFVAHQKVHGYEVQNFELSGVKDGGNALEKVGASSSVPDSQGR